MCVCVCVQRICVCMHALQGGISACTNVCVSMHLLQVGTCACMMCVCISACIHWRMYACACFSTRCAFLVSTCPGNLIWKSTDKLYCRVT
jgi:hypothetical protein